MFATWGSKLEKMNSANINGAKNSSFSHNSFNVTAEPQECNRIILGQNSVEYCKIMILVKIFEGNISVTNVCYAVIVSKLDVFY